MSSAVRGRPTRRLDQPMVAVLEKKGRFLVAEPIFGPGPRTAVERGGAGVGDLVLVGGGKRGARVLRRLGRPDRARDVVEGLMLDRGLHRTYSRAASAEAEASLHEPYAADARVDLRDLPTFTIDPDDARDFDDAVSARREDSGQVRVWIHIADVTAYMRPGGRLEREAFRRGTSVYVPGAVEPMLPEVLSNEACSLRPGEDKLAVTVELRMEGADVTNVSFHRSLVRSDTRLTYGEVDELFAGRARAEEPWGEPLAIAREVAGALHERRDSLEFGSFEPAFDFDPDGNVTGVRYEDQTESHRLIEMLMILANEQVAGYLADRRLPTLYRVHERPEPRSVTFLAEQLASLDIPTPPLPKQMTPQQAADAVGEISRIVVREARGRRAVRVLVLRALKQAYYTPRNLGHAGLASARYCHFTSPIRRYPDVVAHRALLQGLGIDDAAAPAHELEDAGAISSASEREAMKIERDADDVCLAFLLDRVLSESRSGSDDSLPSFEGEVVGLIEKGAFVQFGEERFEGFLPVRRLRGWWSLNELGTALEAEGSGRRLRLGDSLRVQVDRIDPPRGRVDLAPYS
ncbi:MAG TPA: RNB domain-containing ribonuclease [Thermoleophilaceae bacterium]|nr:RNB domain-containing ribonuclease [Thermoleophilaceae bacterium]